MKKLISLTVALLMLVSVVTAVPVTSFAADTAITTVDIKSEKDLYDKKDGGYCGASYTSASYHEIKTFSFTLKNDAYAFIDIESYLDDLSQYVNLDITMISDTSKDEVFSHYTYRKGAENIRELKLLTAGTYKIQIKEEKTTFKTHTNIYVGLLNKNTKFISGSYVKTVKNSGNQSMVIKVNTLDKVSKLFADNSNYGYVAGVRSVGKPYTADSNGCITVPVDNYNSKTFPYFTVLSEDVYGIEHECWFGVITPDTAIVKGIANKTYTGKNISQKFTVECFNDTPTYKVTYSNNKNVGTAKVTITGFDRWNGSVTKTFKINPKGTSVKKVTPAKKKMTVKWSKQATQTTGYEIQYGLKKNFKGAKTYTVKKNKTTKATVKKLKSKKTYYVRIRTYKTVSGKKYYSSWSKSKKVKIK